MDPIDALRVQIERHHRRRGFVLSAILLVLLTGCITACPSGQCVGPYDLTLSSHREGLGL